MSKHPSFLSQHAKAVAVAVLLGWGCFTGEVALAEGRHGRVEQRWWDGAHGHGHYYPVPGYRVPILNRGHTVFYGGMRYAFDGGIWYSNMANGYVVVRPPYGIIINDLPTFATLVTVGALSYYYVNGTYYRPLMVEGVRSYEVVAPPVAGGEGGVTAPAPSQLFVYPRQAQSAEQQSTDEYECHHWAADRSGYDPTVRATGGANSTSSGRADYQRAQAACLEGRGYTVR
ncbi:DUF6515 family protein [Leptothrix ochracea]|uniref:DUF6515 family protein n=1 Tax=Leptothrix ochracea TaxID=735331 RepID=UPI0034E2488E